MIYLALGWWLGVTAFGRIISDDVGSGRDAVHLFRCDREFCRRRTLLLRVGLDNKETGCNLALMRPADRGLSPKAGVLCRTRVCESSRSMLSGPRICREKKSLNRLGSRNFTVTNSEACPSDFGHVQGCWMAMRDNARPMEILHQFPCR